jgi:hypothetical protein
MMAEFKELQAALLEMKIVSTGDSAPFFFLGLKER